MFQKDAIPIEKIKATLVDEKEATVVNTEEEEIAQLQRKIAELEKENNDLADKVRFRFAIQIQFNLSKRYILSKSSHKILFCCNVAKFSDLFCNKSLNLTENVEHLE